MSECNARLLGAHLMLAMVPASPSQLCVGWWMLSTVTAWRLLMCSIILLDLAILKGEAHILVGSVRLGGQRLLCCNIGVWDRRPAVWGEREEGHSLLYTLCCAVQQQCSGYAGLYVGHGALPFCGKVGLPC